MVYVYVYGLLYIICIVNHMYISLDYLYIFFIVTSSYVRTCFIIMLYGVLCLLHGCILHSVSYILHGVSYILMENTIYYLYIPRYIQFGALYMCAIWNYYILYVHVICDVLYDVSYFIYMVYYTLHKVLLYIICI